MNMFSLCYEPALALYSLFYLPHFMARASQADDKMKMINERFGIYKHGPINGKLIWIHAVSVGEVLASRNLIEGLLEESRHHTVLLSTTTPTGRRVAERFASERVRVCYFPIDFSFVVRRALNDFNPSLIILMETEIWPNLIREAARRGIPIGIVNGRISERAFRRYLWIKSWLAELLPLLSFCLVQGKPDYERYVALGMPERLMQVTGNMKFDIVGSDHDEVMNSDVRIILENQLVLMAASTHEGEESILLNAFIKLRQQFQTLRLVLAPRHPERAASVVQEALRLGLSVQSLLSFKKEIFDVLVINEVGRLTPYYRRADVVFMGGSLIPHGGQNPIEAACERKAVIHGPHVSNFSELYAEMDRLHGAVLAADSSEIFEKVYDFLTHSERRQQCGAMASQVVARMKGATDRNRSYLRNLIDSETNVEKVR